MNSSFSFQTRRCSVSLAQSWRQSASMFVIGRKYRNYKLNYVTNFTMKKINETWQAKFSFWQSLVNTASTFYAFLIFVSINFYIHVENSTKFNKYTIVYEYFFFLYPSSSPTNSAPLNPARNKIRTRSCCYPRRGMISSSPSMSQSVQSSHRREFSGDAMHDAVGD